jgi:hypothetical protein
MSKKNNGYSMADWTEKYNAPYTDNYQAKPSEYAGMQSGDTLNYIENRDRLQTGAAEKVRSQNYHGRYE